MLWILRDFLSLFLESTYVLVDGAITEYRIPEEKAYEDLNFRLLCVNDLEDIIKDLFKFEQQTKRIYTSIRTAYYGEIAWRRASSDGGTNISGPPLSAWSWGRSIVLIAGLNSIFRETRTLTRFEPDANVD